MYKNCKNNSCSGGCSPSGLKEVASLKNEIQELRSVVDEIKGNSDFLNGHPIMIIQNSEDVALFNSETGIGEKRWAGFAYCNGGTYYSEKTGTFITTPNFLDKFLVNVGELYDVNDTGGANTVALSVPQLPAHLHDLFDPGHNHDITDPGHTHGMVQSPHTHAASGGAHTHTFSAETSQNGSHEHSTGSETVGSGGTGANLRQANANAGAATSSEGVHSHSVNGTTSSATNSVTVTSASISISNQMASIGITQTNLSNTGLVIGNTGEGVAHENRPPYYAVIYVMKL